MHGNWSPDGRPMAIVRVSIRPCHAKKCTDSPRRQQGSWKRRHHSKPGPRHDPTRPTHIGPEPCADVRKGAGEASAGECTGQALNRERPIIPGADTVPNVEGHTHGRAICERPDDPAWSQTLACADASCTGTGRSPGRPAALITCAALVRIGKARSRSR